jgi:hypothetical protein
VFVLSNELSCGVDQFRHDIRWRSPRNFERMVSPFDLDQFGGPGK